MNIAKLVGIGVLLFVLCIVGCNSCTRINAGHVGIKIDMAGSNRGTESIPVQTGWLFYNPITQQVFEYPTFVQTAKWTKDVNEGNPINEEITFTNKDSMLIAADISLSYSLRPEKVPYFYVKFRNDDINQFTHGFLRNNARDVFNEVAGHYAVEQIMGDNGPFLTEVRAKLQGLVEPIGVQIEQFGFIGAPRPPQAVVDNINAKVQASQLALQKQNEVAQAEAEARKTVAIAEGDAKAKIAIAEGEAKANQLLTSSISDQLIRWKSLQVQQQAIDKWNGVRPLVESGSSGGLLLNVPLPNVDKK